jgi:hypothetical protein
MDYSEDWGADMDVHLMMIEKAATYQYNDTVRCIRASPTRDSYF